MDQLLNSPRYITRFIKLDTQAPNVCGVTPIGACFVNEIAIHFLQQQILKNTKPNSCSSKYDS
jgi:hypothetical protein